MTTEQFHRQAIFFVYCVCIFTFIHHRSSTTKSIAIVLVLLRILAKLNPFRSRRCRFDIEPRRLRLPFFLHHRHLCRIDLCFEIFDAALPSFTGPRLFQDQHHLVTTKNTDRIFVLFTQLDNLWNTSLCNSATDYSTRFDV